MRTLALIATVLVGTAFVSAQAEMVPSDLERLQDAVSVAGKDITALQGRDAAAARRLQAELNDLSDEVTYLKVKMRKERAVPRTEYSDLRDRLENLQNRARGEGMSRGATTAAPAAPAAAPAPTPSPTRSAAGGAYAVPVGTELDVRLQTALNSGTAQLEDRFEATTLVDLKKDDRVLIPAGSTARGVVTAVKAAGRVERTGSISLSFDRITVNGTTYAIKGSLLQAVESEGIRGDAGKLGAGAAVGGILGGIIGGVKGTIAGIVMGAGGTMAATEGKQVDLQPGTVLRMRFDSELVLQ